MALSQKRVPTVSETDTQRAFQQVYDDMNEIINAVNQGHTSKERISNVGKSGDIRIGQNSLGNHFLELCTDEGWVVSSNSVPTGFMLGGNAEDSNDTRILSGNVGIGTATPTTKLNIEEDSTKNEIFKITDKGTNTTSSCFIIPFEMPTTTQNQYCDIATGGAGKYFLVVMHQNGGRWAGCVFVSGSGNAAGYTLGNDNLITVGSDGSGTNKIRITNTYAGAANISGVLIGLDSYGTLTVGSAS